MNIRGNDALNTANAAVELFNTWTLERTGDGIESAMDLDFVCLNPG
jgi:hypothetical protein